MWYSLVEKQSAFTGLLWISQFTLLMLKILSFKCAICCHCLSWFCRGIWKKQGTQCYWKTFPAYGIKDNLRSWLNSCLSDHSQWVKLITRDVMLRSIPCSLLLIIYFNDIFNRVVSSKTFMFDNDVKNVKLLKRNPNSEM